MLLQQWVSTGTATCADRGSAVYNRRTLYRIKGETSGMRPVLKHSNASMNAIRVRAWLLSVFLCGVSGFCTDQRHNFVCNGGYGTFEVKFATGVTVSVGPARNGDFSRRVCRATLVWDKQDLPVVPEASQVDIDVLGADLGLDMPVVAFQVRKSDADPSMAYQIYSLQKPPRLLRTISGGDFFSAADTDLDGRIEIWTGDAGAVDGFEHLSLSEFDFAPTIVMRFEGHRLRDASSEFRPHFDRQIEEVRARLDAQDLSDFRNSDGRLPVMSHLPAEQVHHLRIAKIKVLEIVWSYLYSGREQEAWHALVDMWPPSDFDRIRTSIMNAYAGGIRSQLDGASTGGSRFHVKHFAYIYDTVTNTETEHADSDAANLTADTKPQAILLRRPPPAGIQDALPKSEEMVDLVVDAAGKVRSAKTVGAADKDLISATADWKFIPAFKDGRAVASRLRLAVVPLR
jgi:hypothetical protein